MILSLFNSIHDAWVKSQVELDWGEAVALFQYPRAAEKKEDAEMFNLGSFKSLDDPTVEYARKYHYVKGIKQSTYDLIPGKVRRCKENLLSISGLVLDIDNDFDILEAIDAYKEYEFVLYTTFNNLQPDKITGEIKQKFRVVIPFAKDLQVGDIEGRKAAMKLAFPEVDNSCFSMSQSFYFHSGQYQYTYHNKGKIVDPYVEFPYTAPVVQPVSTYAAPLTDVFAIAHQQAVADSLLTC